MTQSSRRQLSNLLIIAAVAFLLWWVARSVSLAEAWDVLRHMHFRDLLWLALANLAVLWLLTGRWWMLLRGLGVRIPWHRLLGYRLAAFGLSYFTPGPHFGGEPLQVHLPVRHHSAPGDAALAAVTLDKLLELLVNFSFLVAAAIYVFGQGTFTRGSSLSALGYALILLAIPAGLLAAIWAGRHPLAGGLALLGRVWANATLLRVQAKVAQGEELAASLCRQRPWSVAGALLFALLSWAAMIGEFWLATHVLGLDLSLGQAVTAMLAARMAILLPLPAGLGALEASLVMAMGALGAGPSAGLSLALLIRTRDVILGLTGLAIGGVSLWPARRKHPQTDVIELKRRDVSIEKPTP